MGARAIGSGTITFGLVSIPVRLYVATHSEQVAFHLLHASCGTRIRQQFYCPHHKRVVDRKETVRGFEVRKNRYVTFTEPELKALEAEANRAIEIQEFVPLADLDPVYFKDVHYLGPEKGAGKAYGLLAEAMRARKMVGLAQFTHHGKEHLVAIRPYEKGLALHTLYYADEIRPFDAELDGAGKARPSEVEMAEKLIDQLSSRSFDPERFEDRYRARLKGVVRKKEKGEEVAISAPEPARGKVVDLMDALKASLAGGRGGIRRAAMGRRSAGRGKRPGTRKASRRG
jgi:DNA end-binding protein Ku